MAERDAKKMNYTLDSMFDGDLPMKGYVIPHSAIEIAESVWTLSKVLLAVMVFRWAWVTSYSNHAFFTLFCAVAALGLVYYFSKKN